MKNLVVSALITLMVLAYDVFVIKHPLKAKDIITIFLITICVMTWLT